MTPLLGITARALKVISDKNDLWHMTTKEVVARFIKPATLASQCGYCDTLRSTQAGLPNVYISHGVENKWGLLVLACNKFADKNPEHDLFFFIDVLSVDQHSCEPGDFNLPQVRSDVMSLPMVSHLLVLDSLGWALSRLVVLYELFLSITSNTAVVVEAGNIDSYNEYFEANGVDLSYFIKCVRTMASEGSSQGLRENVLLEMESYPGGSARVDQLIRSTLMEVRGPLQAHDEGMYSVLRAPEHADMYDPSLVILRLCCTTELIDEGAYSPRRRSSTVNQAALEAERTSHHWTMSVQAVAVGGKSFPASCLNKLTSEVVRCVRYRIDPASNLPDIVRERAPYHLIRRGSDMSDLDVVVEFQSGLSLKVDSFTLRYFLSLREGQRSFTFPTLEVPAGKLKKALLRVAGELGREPISASLLSIRELPLPTAVPQRPKEGVARARAPKARGGPGGRTGGNAPPWGSSTGWGGQMQRGGDGDLHLPPLSAAQREEEFAGGLRGHEHLFRLSNLFDLPPIARPARPTVVMPAPSPRGAAAAAAAAGAAGGRVVSGRRRLPPPFAPGGSVSSSYPAFSPALDGGPRGAAPRRRRGGKHAGSLLSPLREDRHDGGIPTDTLRGILCDGRLRAYDPQQHGGRGNHPPDSYSDRRVKAYLAAAAEEEAMRMYARPKRPAGRKGGKGGGRKKSGRGRGAESASAGEGVTLPPIFQERADLEPEGGVEE